MSVEEAIDVFVEHNELDRYVSRGGLKLEGALRRVKLDVTGYTCLDVGQSTGGFSDCLLQHGAARVVGVDVGHAQLHASLRNDSRVTCIEGVNAKDPTALRSAVTADTVEARFDLIVADVSFISLTKVIGTWFDLLSSSGRVLALVKPQFEVGADRLARGGIVRDESLFAEVESKVRSAFVASGFALRDYFDSPIEGGDGNREFFLFGAKA